MCGIFGYECTGKYDDRLNVAIPIAAIHMEQRGRVSWGWTDGRTEVIKSMGEISKGFNPSFFGYKQAALHTRQPTTGARVKENSHPFKIGNIIGMHNGMVRNHDELQKKYERKCEVDSEHIFHHLAEGRSLEDIIGYGAIVFYKDGVLHLGRFNGGSLVLVKTSVGWLFASTKEALEVSLQYSGLREGAIFFKLKEDRLYKIVNGQLEKDMKLNFGSYNTSEYGTWENNKWVPKGGGRPASTFPNNHSTSTYGGNYHGTTTLYDKDGQYTIETINGKKYKVHGHGQGRLLTAIEDTPAGMATRSNSGKKKVGSSEVNNRIADMLIAATAAKSQKKDRTADEFPCEYCNDMIKQGELFGMLEHGQVLCQYCCCSYPEPGELIGDILADMLPTDVMLVEAFFGDHDNPKDKTITCDNCNDKLEGSEWFAAASNNTFLCLGCFMEKYKKTTVDELEQKEEQDAAAIAFPGTTSHQIPSDDELAIFNQQITESLERLSDASQDEPEEGINNVVPFRTQQIM